MGARHGGGALFNQLPQPAGGLNGSEEIAKRRRGRLSAELLHTNPLVSLTSVGGHRSSFITVLGENAPDCAPTEVCIGADEA